jgi:signal transduction histidine kinase
MNIAAYGENSRPDNQPIQVFGTGFCDPSVAEQRARTARATALGEMTGGIVHDFRNIFAIVESGLRLAATSFGEPEKARAYIAEARNGIERGQRLASQLLTFGKMPEREPRACDVNMLLTQLEPFLRCGVGPGVRIMLMLDPVPKCLIDQSQFAAAILNVVLNARDAMPNGSEVHIATQAFAAETALSDGHAAPTHVRVRVTDSGLGMPAAVIERIFDPFFTTKGESGTGLGLSQVSACMRLHGGHIDVTSRIGSGTTVDLLFPVKQRDNEPRFGC